MDDLLNFPYSANVFSRHLKKARIFRGFKTQVSLCDRLAICRQVWSLWEAGKRNPTMEQLCVLANFLKIKIEYFFTPDSEPYLFIYEKEKEMQKEKEPVLNNFIERLPALTEKKKETIYKVIEILLAEDEIIDEE